MARQLRRLGLSVQPRRLVALAAAVISLGSFAGGAESATNASKVAFGKPFAVAAGESKVLGRLNVRMTAQHVPMQAGPNGVELFPITYYSLEWHEGKDRQVMNQLLAEQPVGTSQTQYPLFGRYTFTLSRGSNEDEVTLTVFKRTCLLWYTSRNQLAHKSGAIIFTEREDLCCYYSDGPNTCDLGVTRAQTKTDAPYCVLYSNRPQSTSVDETCCCRYERSEPLEKECQARCDRLTAMR